MGERTKERERPVSSMPRAANTVYTKTDKKKRIPKACCVMNQYTSQRVSGIPDCTFYRSNLAIVSALKNNNNKNSKERKRRLCYAASGLQVLSPASWAKYFGAQLPWSSRELVSEWVSGWGRLPFWKQVDWSILKAMWTYTQMSK